MFWAAQDSWTPYKSFKHKFECLLCARPPLRRLTVGLVSPLARPHLHSSSLCLHKPLKVALLLTISHSCLALVVLNIWPSVNLIPFFDMTLVFHKSKMKMLFGVTMKIECGYIPGKTIAHLGKEVQSAGVARWDGALPWCAEGARRLAQMLVKCQKQVLLFSSIWTSS